MLPEGFTLPEREPRTEEDIAPLTDEFLASELGAALVRDLSADRADALRAFVTKMFTWAGNLFDDSFRWTPSSLAVLAFAVRDELTTDSLDAPLMHETVKALVRYAHERKGWGDRYLDGTLQFVDERMFTRAGVLGPDVPPD
jgi:hypothetical protein